MEQKFRSIVAPSILVVAGCATFAMVTWPTLSLNYRLALVRDLSVVAAGATWVSLGIRDLRRHGATLKSAALPLAGALLLVVIGVSSFYAIRFYESAADLIRAPDLEQVTQTANKVIANPDSTAEERAWASEFRARVTFVRTGELVPILDPSGEQTLFSPTADDRDQRRMEEKLRELAENGPPTMSAFLGMSQKVLK